MTYRHGRFSRRRGCGRSEGRGRSAEGHRRLARGRVRSTEGRGISAGGHRRLTREHGRAMRGHGRGHPTESQARGYDDNDQELTMASILTRTGVVEKVFSFTPERPAGAHLPNETDTANPKDLFKFF